MAALRRKTLTPEEIAARRARARRLRAELLYVPNLITYARVAAIPAVVWLMYRADPRSSFLATALYCAASTTDYIDGWLARRMGQTSVVGKFLDPLADKLFVMAALVMCVYLGRVPVWAVVVLLARETTITGLRSIASSEGMVIGAGFAGKMKTAFQMVGLLFLLLHYAYEVSFGLFSVRIDMHAVGIVLLYISLFFSVYSAGEYFVGFVRHLVDEPT